MRKDLLAQTVAQLAPLDTSAMAAARKRQDSLTKPPGSLGRLEELSAQLAGIFRTPLPRITSKLVVVAAGDHGVTAEGVSPYPSSVTAQMVLNFLRGGATISVLARSIGCEMLVVDAGVASTLPDHIALRRLHIGNGTANMARGPAMSRRQAVRCLEEGIRLAASRASAGVDLFATGDMGIGNTTAASAVTAAMTEAAPSLTTGRGTSLDDAGLRRNVSIVRKALRVNRPDPDDSMDVLAKVGGVEIGVLAGIILGVAAARKPVVLDGFISGASALLACGFSPLVRPYLIASHRSVEPGHRVALRHLRLRPLLDLQMRLGEGTGAVLAMPIVDAAWRTLAGMATFAEASVSNRVQEPVP
ncbi:MAG: nicotinate-nucleotide--dimethylbenzimidazole phosphoribosyltransferase [Dehalococcoidia bacterium]|nr:nicotinate-nucleotide--dimethylbenzimidazole phosphoribosyltransferase [Dehalococcoidia bacterium]